MVPEKNNYVRCFIFDATEDRQRDRLTVTKKQQQRQQNEKCETFVCPANVFRIINLL